MTQSCAAHMAELCHETSRRSRRVVPFHFLYIVGGGKMNNERILRKSADFIECMCEIVPAPNFLFRAFATSGIKGLSSVCRAARDHCAGDAATAAASLTIHEGACTNFDIRGAHAVATVVTQRGRSMRMCIVMFVAAALIVLVCTILRASPTPRMEK